VRADEKLTAFVELEAAIPAVSSQNPNESSLSGQRFAASLG
jgi:hypothetical protein